MSKKQIWRKKYSSEIEFMQAEQTAEASSFWSTRVASMPVQL